MWAATVLLCVLRCVTVEDELGPYETEAACEARAYEIAADLLTFGRQRGLPPPRYIGYRCLEVDTGEVGV